MSANQVVAQLPGAVKKVAKGAAAVGDTLLGSPAHLADQINYGVNAKIWQGMRDRGEINDETLSQLLNQSGDQAGFKINDSNGEIARKTAAAVAMPTATILTAGAAPAVFGGKTLAARMGTGAALGAGYGAGFGGLSTLGQDDTPDPVDYFTGIAGGAAGGALLGGAMPIVGKALVKGAQVAKNSGEGGFIAGDAAIGFPKAKAAEQTFKGPEGKPRFEVSDKNAKLNEGFQPEPKHPDDLFDLNPRTAKLGEVLDHPALYKQYPELKNLPVKFDDTITGAGSFNGKVLRINPAAHQTNDALKGTILHEVQHAIQHKEKFAAGGSPDYMRYKAAETARIKLQTKMNAYQTKYGGQISPYNPYGGERLTPQQREWKDIQDLHGQLNRINNGQTRSGVFDQRYHKLAGEAEARSVERRMGKTQQELDSRFTEKGYGMPEREGPYAPKYTGTTGKLIVTKHPEGVPAGKSNFRQGEPKYNDNGTDFVARERFNIPALKKISSGGSDRNVYDLGDGHVLKVAKTARGLAQNEAEHDYYAQDAGLIPTTKEAGKNYVVSEKVGKPDANTKAFVKGLQEFSPQQRDNKTSDFQNYLEKHGMLDILNYDPMWNDFMSIRNWGTTAKGKPIHVDGGSLNNSILTDPRYTKEVRDSSGYSFKKPKANLDDPEFRDVYNQSRAAKKKYADADPATMYSLEDTPGLNTKSKKALAALDRAEAETNRLLKKDGVGVKTAKPKATVRAGIVGPELPKAKPKPLAKANGDAYEAATAKALKSQGYKVETTGKNLGRQDGGIDNIARKDGETILIQDKFRSRDTSIHFGTIAQMLGAEMKYKNANKGNIRSMLRTTVPVDADAAALAKTHGIEIVQTDLNGKTVAATLAPSPKGSRFKLTNEDKDAMLNSVPMAQRDDLLSQLADKNSIISQTLKNTSQANARQFVRRYYQGFNPEGSFTLNQFKALGASLSDAKTPAEVKKILSGEPSPTTDALNAKLKSDPAFMTQLVSTHTKSGIREIINATVKEPIYTPLKNGLPKSPPASALYKPELEPMAGGGESKSVPKKSGLIERTVKGGQRTYAEVKQMESPAYDHMPNRQTMNEAVKAIQSNEKRVFNNVMNEKIERTAALNAQGMILAERAQQAGHFDEAMALWKAMAPGNTEAGQTIQILAMWGRTKPEGVVKYAQKVVDDANAIMVKDGKNAKFSLTAEQAKAFRTEAERIDKLPDSQTKLIDTAKLLQKIHAQVPASVAQRLKMSLYYAQLLNPKTAIRNIVGNGGFWLTKNFTDAIMAPVDATLTGARRALRQNAHRTTYMPDLIGQIREGRKEFAAAWKEAKQNVNLSGLEGQTQTGTQGPAFNNAVGRTLDKLMKMELSTFDRAFYKAAYYQSVKNQTRGAGILEKDATKGMKEIADFAGKYATFQDNSNAAKAFVAIKKGLNVGKEFGVGSFVLNYPKTPGNLIARGLDFSPVGYVKAVMNIARPLFRQGPFDQKAFIDNFGRATVGTAGLMGMGATMHKMGIITGAPDSDKSAAAADSEQGLGGYRINTSALKRWVSSGFDPASGKLQEGDQLVTYDWFQPAAIGISMGANIDENKGNNKGAVARALSIAGSAGSSIEGGINTIAQQPLVQGVTKLTGTGNLAAGAIATATGVPASFVPTLLSQINQLTDNTTRSTYDPNWLRGAQKQVANKVPILGKTLEPTITPTGQNKERYQDKSNNVLNVFLNPAFVSTYKGSPVLDEVQRLQDTTGETSQFPKLVAKNFTKDGQGIPLSPTQLTNLQRTTGQLAVKQLGTIMDSADYKSADDAQKVVLLTNGLTAVTKAAKIKALEQGIKAPAQGEVPESAFMGQIVEYAKAIGTDPVTAFDRIGAGDTIRRTDNGAIIVDRMSLKDSQAVKTKGGGNNPNMKLDHTIPLELGGSNGEDNLKLVPTATWASYSPVENYLGKQLAAGNMTKQEVQGTITKFKNGQMAAADIIKTTNTKGLSGATKALLDGTVATDTKTTTTKAGSTTKKAKTTKAASGTKKAAKAKSYDYAARFATGYTASLKNASALRNLIRAPKIKRKAIKVKK